MKEIFENRQVGTGFELLRKVDIFGVPIQINFNNESKHTTKIGGIVSLSIFGLLIAYLLNLLMQISNKSNPQVIQEELIVTNPSQYNLTDENFGFAITLLDENYTPFLDETYYTISAQFLSKVNQVMADGTIGQVFKQENIALAPCTSSSFQVQGTQEFFLSQLYANLYCIQDVNSLYLVGQFDQPLFSVIQFYVNVCSGSQCQNPTVIQKKLSASQLQIYYSNQVVKVSNIQNPFEPIGQSLFWQTNLDQAQVINLTYINTYVTDDIGLISTQYVTQSSLLYSDNRTTYNTNANSYFYYISIFMEKNRESQYTRKFLKLTQAVSQVGGIYNVLFFLGCLLAQPYSYLELERKIVNSTFSFSSHFVSNQKKKDEEKEKKKKEKEEKKKNKKEKKQKGDSAQKESSNNNQEGSQTNRNSQSGSDGKSDLSNNQQINQILNETFSNRDYILEDQGKKESATDRPVLDKQNSDQNSSSLKVEPEKGPGNAIKAAFSEIKIKTSEYFSFYLSCFKCFKNDIQTILNFGTSKICEFTDICYIVNKLIELEKIKHLLLNDYQLKLFEYVPKPKITKSIIENYKEARAQNKQVKKAIKSKSTLQLTAIENKIRRQSTNQLNILTIMNRSQLEKAREAQKAYNYIYKQQRQLSNIDQKLLQLLDENHIPLFNTNSFDSSILGNYPQTNTIHLDANNSHSRENPEQTPPSPPENHKENDILEQLQNKKSIYFLEQKRSIVEEIVDNNNDNTKINDISLPPSNQEESMLPAINIEDIIMSQQTNDYRHPQQLSVVGASPAFYNNNYEDISLQLKDITQSVHSHIQYQENTMEQE